ncbi:hypothetical protein [Aliikangiella sp. IMCC44359]|uniref:hypothetical protein n=1 Tax=Aliikangiella sp. IMCC44359 TaxID=3459125 RepID=UPI00403A8077
MYIVIRLLLVATLTSIISSCSKNYQLVKNEVSTTLKLVAPKEKALKQILMVEAYHTMTCFYDRTLNHHHPDYQGRLLYAENIEGTGITESVKIKANSPLTITATLSSIFGDKNSDICYFQPTSFIPSGDKNYEIFFSPFCEIMLFEADNAQSHLIPIDTNTTNNSCLPVQP